MSITEEVPRAVRPRGPRAERLARVTFPEMHTEAVAAEGDTAHAPAPHPHALIPTLLERPDIPPEPASRPVPPLPERHR